MSRYIDADAIISFVDAGHLRNPLELAWSDNDVVDMIESRPTVDAVPVAVFDRIIEELELHMYRIEGQDDLLYPLTPRQMTMNSTFEIAIDVVERIRKEQTDFVPRKEDADGERKDGEKCSD